MKTAKAKPARFSLYTYSARKRNQCRQGKMDGSRKSG